MNFKRISSLALEERRTHLLEHESREVCISYGVPIPPGSVAKSKDEAVRIANQLGYPVVLRGVSKDVIHKSEAGAVVLDLNSGQGVAEAYDRIISNVKRYKQDAQIYGTLIAKMAPEGVETFVGMKRDRIFNSVVMFGIGGILVEVYRDVSFRIAPVSRREAYEMLGEIKGSRLLEGFRGSEPVDKDAIVDIILKVARMAEENREINSIDLNPVTVYGRGALALDTRIILANSRSARSADQQTMIALDS